MANRDDLLALLTNDATLMATLTGGAYAKRFNRQDSDFSDAIGSGGLLNPFAILSLSTDTREFPGVQDMDVSRQFFFVWVYDDQLKTYASIDTALARIETVLDGASVTLSNGSAYQINVVDTVTDQHDPEIRANAGYVRCEMPKKAS